MMTSRRWRRRQQQQQQQQRRRRRPEDDQKQKYDSQIRLLLQEMYVVITRKFLREYTLL
jgi:hypothetical protein